MNCRFLTTLIAFAATSAFAQHAPAPVVERLEQRNLVCRSFEDASEFARKHVDLQLVKSFMDSGRCRWVAAGVRVSMETAYRGQTCIKVPGEPQCLWGVLQPARQAKRLGLSHWQNYQNVNPGWRPSQADQK
jgi:hypothetical protein